MPSEQAGGVNSYPLGYQREVVDANIGPSYPIGYEDA
ncbi:MAG: hypothetical protein QOC89_2912 [Paraburkholderia sp.]|nr:hypothetical protein [Paraburkholderia sp.]